MKECDAKLHDVELVGNLCVDRNENGERENRRDGDRKKMPLTIQSEHKHGKERQRVRESSSGGMSDTRAGSRQLGERNNKKRTENSTHG